MNTFHSGVKFFFLCLGVGICLTMAASESAAFEAGRKAEATSEAVPPNPAGYIVMDVEAPAEVGPTEMLALQVRARNVGWETAKGVRLTIDEASGAQLAGRESYPLPDMAVGESVEVDLTARVLAAAGEEVRGVIRALGGNQTLSTEAEFVFFVRQAAAEEWRPGPGGGRWRPQHSRVEVELPSVRDESIAVVRHRRLRDETRGGRRTLAVFELTAADADGRLVERFEQPLTLRWYYGEMGEEASAGALSFAWLNEAGAWEATPTEVDASGEFIMAQITHFSTWAVVNTVGEAPEDSFSGLEAELSSGALNYRYALPLLPRPGGFGPGLALSYNSRRREEQGGFGSGGSWVGWGWGLDGLDYINHEYLNEYRLALAGATYTITETVGGGGVWWMAQEAPWLQIRRSADGSEWHVRTPEGTYYKFTEQLTSVDNCATGATQGKQYMVSNITAAADDGINYYTVNFFYGRAMRTRCGVTHYFDVWPTEITYNGIGVANTKVVFDYYRDPQNLSAFWVRRDWPYGCGNDLCSNFGNANVYWRRYALKDITIKAGDVQVRRYHFSQRLYPNNAPGSENLSCSTTDDGYCRLLLDKIQVFGKNDVARPALSFGYSLEGQFDACHKGDGCLVVGMDNAQGGVARLDYSSNGEAMILTRRTITDTVTATAMVENYSYSSWYSEANGYSYAEVKDGAGVILSQHGYLNYAPASEKGKWGLEYWTAFSRNGQALAYSYRDYDLPEGLSDRKYRHVLMSEYRYRPWPTSYQVVAKTTYSYARDHQGSVQYGNISHIYDYDYDGTTPRLQRWRERWYYPFIEANGRFIVNRLAEEKVFDAGGNCRSQTRNYYDGQANHQSPPTKGLLTKVEAAQDACGGGFVTQVQNSYDPAWHNLTRSQDALGHGLSTTYDSEFHVFVTTQSNDLNQTTTTTYPPADVVQRALGLPSQTMDANNQVTSYSYDGFGRPLTVNRPLGHASVDEQWAYTDYSSAASPRRVLHKLYDEVTTPVNPESGYLAEWTFYDGLGRVLQRQGEHESDANKSILVSQSYDWLGRLERTSVGYEYAGAPGTYRAVTNWNGVAHSRSEYDSLGRVVRMVGPDGADVRYEYRYLQTASFDAMDHLVISEEDGLGRTKAVRQYEGVYPTLNWNSLPAAYSTTSYEYDVLDRLDKVILPDDTPGNSVRMDPTYNLLGQKTAMTDPDMGAWSYGYDGAGNLTRQTDARGTVLCYEYDALNRLRYVREDQTAPKDCTGTLAWRTTHEYDTLNWQPAANGIGRRNRLNDGSGTTTWAYDVRGRVTSETKAIGNPGGGTFVTQWTYDAADRVKTMTYPGGNTGGAGEVVNSTYNPQGLLEQMYRSSPAPIYYYVGATDYNALGQVELRKLGSTAGVLSTDYAYRTDNFRLQWIRTGPSSPFEGLQKLEYAYDAAGNVDWVKDYKAPGSVQTLDFTYDALNRLTNGVTSGGSSGAYNETYGYADNAGGKASNLTSKTGLGNYTYGVQAADCPEGALSKPHAVVTAGTYTYCYDQNGNMRRRTIGTSTYTLSYDAENRLTGVSGAATASFVYDGDGGRVKATFGTTTTAYVGEHYEWTGNTSTSKKYYYANGQRIAMRVGGTLSWLLSDHLGSTAVTANGSGVRTGEVWYKPWGDYRGTAYGTTPTTFRYTGQREDATIGLYFYSARFYDPVLGRFVQPDTIVPEPGNPGSLNRYSYVLNNPLRYTDPSGHAPQKPGDPDDMPGDCATQWCWENRWYRGHGYSWTGSGWSLIGADAYFYDEGILNDTIGEAGISFLASDWDWNTHQEQMKAIGQGIVRFGLRLVNGLAHLRSLLGGGVMIKHGSLMGHPHALPPGTQTVRIPYSSDVTWNQQTIVHELAHVIDWNSSIGGTMWVYGSYYPTTQHFSDAWMNEAPLTGYAACTILTPCVNRWERWAEALTVWVFGNDYYGSERPLGVDVSAQMTRMSQLLNGR